MTRRLRDTQLETAFESSGKDDVDMHLLAINATYAADTNCRQLVVMSCWTARNKDVFWPHATPSKDLIQSKSINAIKDKKCDVFTEIEFSYRCGRLYPPLWPVTVTCDCRGRGKMRTFARSPSCFGVPRSVRSTTSVRLYSTVSYSRATFLSVECTNHPKLNSLGLV